jgi:O6-methylguanine-DNA--protein-cysteine methyltransferase
MSINVFNTPRVLKGPLADFLNVPIGTSMTYTDINRLIKRYIENNNLIDRRTHRITTDNRLCNLFGIQPGETTTYRNIMHYVFDLVEKRSAAAATN